MERFRRFAHRWLLPALLTVVAMLFAPRLVESSSWLNSLLAQDFHERYVSAPIHPHPGIVIVTVEDETKARLGIPRDRRIPYDVYARLVRHLDLSGARTVLFDFYFQEGEDGLDVLAEEIRRASADVIMPLPGEVLAESETEPDGLQIAFDPLPSELRRADSHLYFGAGHYLAYESWIGAVLIRTDHSTGKPLPHIVWQAASSFAGGDPRATQLDAVNRVLSDGNTTIEIGMSNEVITQFPTSARTFEQLELSEALDSRRFKNKLVIVGDARKDQDTVYNEALGEAPGVYFVASSVNTILSSERLRYVGDLASTTFVFVLCLLASAAAIGLRPLSFSSGLVGAFLVAYFVPELLTQYGYSMERVGTIVSLVMGVAASATAGVLIGQIPSYRKAGATTDATVLFADVRSSTEFLIEKGADSYRKRMEQLQSQMRSVVEHHGGEIERTTGDGVFCTFRGDQHHIRALDAASALASSHPDLLAIGVESGEITGGYVFEGGHRSWSSAGRPVNCAQRIQALAARLGVGVLFGPILAAAVGAPLKSLGFHEMKGFAEPMEVFEPDSGSAVLGVKK